MIVLMEKIGFHFLILALCIVVSLFENFMEVNSGQKNSSEFELVKKDKGIALYERWYKMGSGELTREVKAVCHIDAPLDSAIALLKNESQAKNWNQGTHSVRILPQKGNNWVSYIQYNLPWPMENQDCVLQNTPQHISKDYKVIDFKTVEHEFFPEVKGVHRIPFIKGKWVFSQGNKGFTTEYYITTTPSTILPCYLIDPIIRNNLISTIDNFKSLLED